MRKGALKAAVPALVLLVVDDEVERFRANGLDEGDRLEIIGFLAAQNGRTAANEFRANMDLFRAVLLEAKDLARTWGMVLLIAGSLLMLVINLPGLSGGMRWLGSSLTIAGALYFSGGENIAVHDYGLDSAYDGGGYGPRGRFSVIAH